MALQKSYVVGASLLSALLLSGANCAVALEVGVQVGRTPPLNVNVNLPLINNTRANVVVPPVGGGGGLGASVNVAVPPVIGLPPVGARVDVNTAAPAPIGVGVSLGSGQVQVGGTPPGAPPAPNLPVSGPTQATQEQLLQQRLAQLPTCR